MIPGCNLNAYRERDKPDVVVDGKTTFSSSVSIALIVSKLGRVEGSSHPQWRQVDLRVEGDARDDLP